MKTDSHSQPPAAGEAAHSKRGYVVRDSLLNVFIHDRALLLTEDKALALAFSSKAQAQSLASRYTREVNRGNRNTVEVVRE